MKKNTRGFSLIELLIVVAIILIIAAIAIPNLLRSRIAANQASAVGSLRTINTAEITYSSTYNAGYSAHLGDLGPPAAGANPDATHAGLLDSVLAGAAGADTSTKSGYGFTYTAGAPTGVAPNTRIDTYWVIGVPTTVGTTGQNSYFTDMSGVVRQDTTGAAPTAATGPALAPIGG